MVKSSFSSRFLFTVKYIAIQHFSQIIPTAMIYTAYGVRPAGAIGPDPKGSSAESLLAGAGTRWNHVWSKKRKEIDKVEICTMYIIWTVYNYVIYISLYTYHSCTSCTIQHVIERERYCTVSSFINISTIPQRNHQSLVLQCVSSFNNLPSPGTAPSSNSVTTVSDEAPSKASKSSTTWGCLTDSNSS